MPAVTMNNGNPDFFRTTLQEPPGSARPHRTVIASTLSELVIWQALNDRTLYHDVPADTNLTIRALTVTLVGTISIPSGDVRIECKTLCPPCLDVLAGGVQNGRTPTGRKGGCY